VHQASENSRDFGFRDQIRRASVSIMNNIAEGFERQTGKEFKQFLFIAKGSCAEVGSMLYLALELSPIKKEALDQMLGQTIEISKMLSG
jgi:four helix bundle protein